MILELDDYSDNEYLPDEYGEDDILTVFVKSMGGLTLALLGGSLLALFLLSRRNRRGNK